jgi:predicted regulator of Ras-like GTPase activity (Roadblock/LC7/MglB family)
MGCVSVRPMPKTARALADLTEISSQIQAAVVFDREGTVLAATLDDERAGRLAATALELFRAADGHRTEQLVQLDAVLRGGSVFVVRQDDRLIAATTSPEPTVGLVFYDLKTCLRALGEEEKPKPKREPRPKPAPAKRAPRKKKDAAS